MKVLYAILLLAFLASPVLALPRCQWCTVDPNNVNGDLICQTATFPGFGRPNCRVREVTHCWREGEPPVRTCETFSICTTDSGSCAPASPTPVDSVALWVPSLVQAVTDEVPLLHVAFFDGRLGDFEGVLKYQSSVGGEREGAEAASSKKAARHELVADPRLAKEFDAYPFNLSIEGQEGVFLRVELSLEGHDVTSIVADFNGSDEASITMIRVDGIRRTMLFEPNGLVFDSHPESVD